MPQDTSGIKGRPVCQRLPQPLAPRSSHFVESSKLRKVIIKTSQKRANSLNLIILKKFLRLINSFIWHVDKKVIEEQESLMKRVQTQQVLKEIEQSHYSYYENKEESEKFFDKWLINQGFLPDDEIQKQAQAAMSNIAIPKTKKKDKRIVLSSFVSGKTLIENKKTEAAVAKSESENENAEKKKKSEPGFEPAAG